MQNIVQKLLIINQFVLPKFFKINFKFYVY